MTKDDYKKLKSITMIYIFLFIGITGFAQSKEKIKDLIVDCQEAKQEFLKVDFEMKKYFSNAYGYVIFPNVGKGGVGIGGAFGNGIAYEKGRIVGVVKLSQVNIGFQFGGQAYREIIFFENKRLFDDIKKDKIKLAAQASAVAATEGASANAKYDDGILIFTVQKGGLMYEASIGGQTFKFKSYIKK